MKKLTRTIVFILTVAALALCFAACGGNDGGESTPPPNGGDKYTVTWKDESGDVITTTEVDSGTVPSYTYTKQDTVEWHYTVEGWSNTVGGDKLSALPAVSGNATYYAVVSKTKRKYTVTLSSDGGGDYIPQQIEYGSTFAEPSNKPSQSGKRFLGWCTDAACQKAAVFPITVTGNVTLYAAWGTTVNIKTLLQSLINGYKLDPMSYIPEAMRPGYTANAVDATTVKKAESDYANAVNVLAMPHSGFGEQWHMVSDNLKQSQLFFNALSVVEDISAATVTAFNNYIDSNPADTAHHEFKHGIYNVTVDCSATRIYYVLDYTATFPVIGEQNAQIALSMDLFESDRTVRIQLGDANALAYKITDNGYEFAIKYMGARRAMFRVERDGSGKVTGHINEFITASGVTDKAIASAADFYIDGNYVSAVGNKASGIPGFSGYISELYNKTTGKMLGYEVRETLSKITYNTLWFDLADVSGISSIRYDADAEKFYVNGRSSAWEAKKVSGIGTKMASRRYDIEFRTQYFYDLDGNEIEVKTPMLFVQEEQFDTLNADVADKNSGVNVSVTLGTTYINKIKSDYATLVGEFIENKDEMTVDAIIEFIGDKVEFEQE